MSHLPATRRPNVLMPDEYLPPNKILFLQNLPETVSKDQLTALFSQCVLLSLRHFFYRVPNLAFVLPPVAVSLFGSLTQRCRYPNLHEVRMVPTKKDIAFVEYYDEASATNAKDALHNYKMDGENKIKVRKAFCNHYHHRHHAPTCPPPSSFCDIFCLVLMLPVLLC